MSKYASECTLGVSLDLRVLLGCKVSFLLIRNIENDKILFDTTHPNLPNHENLNSKPTRYILVN